MNKIFNKKTTVDVAVFDEIKHENLTEQQKEETNKLTKLNAFPHEKFAEYLLEKDFNQLDVALHQLFYNNLPHNTICKDCNDCQITNNQKQIPEWNCGPAYVEFSVLKTVAAKNLIFIIETNRSVLSKKTIQQLAVLFFTTAFKFKDLHSFYKIGETVKFLTKEGFKEISTQIEQMEYGNAKKLISENYYKTNDELIQTKLGDPGHSDFLKIKKKFWKNKLDQIERSKPNSDSKSKKVTFVSPLSELQLKKLLTELKSNRIISDSTSEDIFFAVFRETELNTINTKISWLKANNLLAYFIDALIRENIINEGNHWNIAECCFTKSRNLANASQKYKETKTGQPKEAVIINEILNGL